MSITRSNSKISFGCICWIISILIIIVYIIISLSLETKPDSISNSTDHNELIVGKTYLIGGTELPLMSCSGNDISQMRYLPDPGLIEIKRVLTNGERPGATRSDPWYRVSLPEHQNSEWCVNSTALILADMIVPL